MGHPGAWRGRVVQTPQAVGGGSGLGPGGCRLWAEQRAEGLPGVPHPPALKADFEA